MGSDPAVERGVSLAPTVAKVPPILLAALTFGTEGAVWPPDVADTDVELDTWRAAEAAVGFSEAFDTPSMVCVVDTYLALDELSLPGDILPSRRPLVLGGL